MASIFHDNGLTALTYGYGDSDLYTTGSNVSVTSGSTFYFPSTDTDGTGVGFILTSDMHTPSKLLVSEGYAQQIELPDGTIIDVKEDGSFKLIDKDAKVKYRANRMKDFNRYINASDLLEEFIRDCGRLGVRQDQMLHIPIELFINWIVLKAAKEDGEPEPKDVPKLEQSQKMLPAPRHKCKWCGRFISNEMFDLGINFCDESHLYLYMQKVGLKFED